MLTPDEEIALKIARSLIDAGIPVFAARPALLPSGERDWLGGSGKTGYILPSAWEKTVPTRNWLDPTAPGWAEKAWRPGWALAAVMGHGLDLLDVDPRSGGVDSRKALVEAGLWPITYGTAATPSGGLHEFVATMGVRSRDDLRPGLDVKAGMPSGEGRGFAFIAPTVKRSKVTGELLPYRWVIPPRRPAEGDLSGAGIAELIAERRAERTEGTDPGELGTPIPHGSHDATMRDYVWRLRHRLSEGEALALALLRGQDCVPCADPTCPDWTPEMTREKVRRAYRQEVEEFTPDAPWPAYDEAVAALEAAEEEAAAAFTPVDWAALWAAPVDEAWLVPGLVPARRGVALYSAPKVGKSLLTLELAVAVSRGAPFLGEPTEPAVVLYVDHENDLRGDVRDRLQSMGYSPADLGGLRYLSMPPMSPLDGPAGAAQLLEVAQREGAELVVLDTVSRTVAGEENANDTWLSFYRHTGRALKRAGIAYLRLDHSGKDDEKGMRGGSAKSGDVDLVWRMVKKSETEFLLICDANRLPVDRPIIRVERITSPRLTHVPSLRTATDDRMDKQTEVMEVLDARWPGACPSVREALDALREEEVKVRREIVQDVLKARRELLRTARV